MSPNSEDPPSSEDGGEANTVSQRDIGQWVGVFVVVTGTLLVVLSSVNLVMINDSTVRLLLLFGSALIVGREAANRAI